MCWPIFVPMKKIVVVFLLAHGVVQANLADTTKVPDKKALKFNLNQSGSHYIQATLLNQTWVRYTENNPGTTRFGRTEAETYDFGLRRTRIQLFGQINDRAFIYFQFGQNNFNATYNYSSSPANRKIAAFFHDALCEYKVSKGNALKLGGGLTVLNALSRFSQPSIGSILTLDVPVFLQYTVDQTDQFDRRLCVYARGQVHKLDYRFYISNPFPINSNGAAVPALSDNSNFVNPAALPNGKSVGVRDQYGAYLSYNIFENEAHTTPYMTGTYLGAKKVWTIASGLVFQKNALWHLERNASNVVIDTAYTNMLHFSVESFLDMPLNKEKGTALSAFAGFYAFNYGKNYLRYNGIMNPASGSTSSALLSSSAYGNAFPMFGTGNVIYAQLGYLLPKSSTEKIGGQLLPYASVQYARYEALKSLPCVVLDAGINYLIDEHRSKITLGYQNRPTYTGNSSSVNSGPRRNCVIAQYQIFF